MENESRHPNNALLFSGSLLIVVAMVVLASAGWGSISPVARALIVLAPPVLLYAISFRAKKRQGTSTLSQVTLYTASIILPLSLATAVYQSGLYPYSDATLVFFVSLLSLVAYIFLEFSLKERWHSIGTIIAALFLVFSFAEIITASNWLYSLFSIILAYFFLNVARFYDMQTLSNPSLPWYVIPGYLLGLGGLVTLPGYLVATLSLSSTSSEALTLVLYTVVSALLFGIAMLYSKDWQLRKTSSSLGLRQIAENASALVLILPAIGAAISYSNISSVLIAVVMSVAAIILGSYVKVRAFRVGGLIAAAICLIRLIAFGISSIGSAWPIILLVIGFILIWLAHIGQQAKNGGIMSLWNFEPVQTLFGLGINPQKTSVPAHQEPNSKGADYYVASKNSLTWTQVGLVVVVIIIAALLLGAML